MFCKCFFFATVCSATVNDFSIGLCDSNFNATIHGMICIDFTLDRDFLAYFQSPHNNEDMRSIRLREDFVHLRLCSGIPEPRRPRESTLVGASKQSPLTRLGEHAGIVIYPVSRDAGRVVIAPSNPSAYAFQGRLFYSTTFHDDHWEADIGIRQIPSASNHTLLNEPVGDDIQFDNCFLCAYPGYMQLPGNIIENLLLQFVEIGIHVFRRPYDDGGSQEFLLQHVTDSIVDSLPTIQVLLRDQTNEHVSIAVISPREYLEDHPDDPSFKHLLFTSAQDAFACQIGRRILNTLVIHMDATNSRIGFGEPIQEIDF